MWNFPGTWSKFCQNCDLFIKERHKYPSRWSISPQNCKDFPSKAQFPENYIPTSFPSMSVCRTIKYIASKKPVNFHIVFELSVVLYRYRKSQRYRFYFIPWDPMRPLSDEVVKHPPRYWKQQLTVLFSTTQALAGLAFWAEVVKYLCSRSRLLILSCKNLGWWKTNHHTGAGRSWFLDEDVKYLWYWEQQFTELFTTTQALAGLVF